MSRVGTRRSSWFFVAIIAISAFVIPGLLRTQLDVGVRDFVPADDRVLNKTDKAAAAFGGDPIVVMLEFDKPGAALAKDTMPDLLRLEGELSKLTDVAAVYGPATVLNQVAGQAQTLLAELVGYRDGLRGKAIAQARKAGKSRAEVTRIGIQATRSFDARYAKLLARGMPSGLPTLNNQTFVNSVVYDTDGQPRAQWRFVVPNDSTIAVLIRPRPELDQAAIESLVDQVRATVDKAEIKADRVVISGIPAVVADLGSQIQRELPMLAGVALLAVGTWFVFVRWTGRKFRLLPLGASLLGTLVTLAATGWLGVGLTLGVVAFLPVVLGIGSDFMTYLHRGAPRRTVMVSALATSASFAALAIAPLPLVRQLGVTLAIGIAITVAISFALQRWVVPTSAAREFEPDEVGKQWQPFEQLSGLALPVKVVGCGIAAVVAGIGWAVLPSLPITADFQSLASNLSSFDDAKDVERVMGSSGEVAIAVTGKDVLSAQSLEWMQQVQNKIVADRGDEMRPILSPPGLLQFLGSGPTPDELAAAMRLLPEYLSSSVIRSDREMAIMSFGVRLEDAESLQSLRDAVRAELGDPPNGVQAEVVGLPMVAVSSYESLSRDQYVTAGFGIVAAGLVLAVGLKRRSDAILAVVAATITTGLVLAGMAIFGIGLNPITAAVGSLAAAVACEFAVLSADARRRSDGGLGRAVLLAAAASATGYLVLAASRLSLIREFGLLLAVTVGVAIVIAQIAVVLWVRKGEEVAAQ